MPEKRKAEKLPSDKRAQLYTTWGSGALRPAGGVLRTADDFRRFPIYSNHHRGSYPSPALALPATPLWACHLKILQRTYFI